jgi:MFS family permease
MLYIVSSLIDCIGISLLGRSEKLSRAGTLQGILLLLPITMAVMGVVVLSPVLPRMQAHFEGVQGAEYLVPVALTLPALCIALLSPIAGAVVDFFGRRRTLLVSLVAYAGVGMLPLVLDDLKAIIVSRILLGAMEAAIVTSSTTLIGDYFEGGEREKWLAYQTALASASAVVLFAIGGALGNISWRGPFAVYGSSLLFFAGLLFWTWEPQPVSLPTSERIATAHFPWRTLVPLSMLAAFGGTMFFTMQIQLGYLLSNYYDVRSPGRIGLFTAIGSLSVPLGSFAFRRAAKMAVPMQLLLSFGLLGASFVLMNHSPSLLLLMVNLVINQFGCGILLPTLVVWAMGRLPSEFRGRGTGLFMSGWWVGQFLSPQIVTLIGKRVGGLPEALQVFGFLCLGAAIVAALSWRRPIPKPTT